MPGVRPDRTAVAPTPRQSPAVLPHESPAPRPATTAGTPRRPPRRPAVTTRFQDFAADVRMHVRLATALPGYLRCRPTVERAREIVRARLASRETNFVRLVQQAVFENPHSPYLPLLRRAGCELADFRRIVEERGVEGTLRALHSAGVYVTFEEFKGRRPIVRRGVELTVDPRDFDNPAATRHLKAQTGGSTGFGTQVPYDFHHKLATTWIRMLSESAHGLVGVPTALWHPILPSTTGIGGIMRYAQMQNPVRRWFTPIVSSDLRPVLRYRLATAYVLCALRALGNRVAWPEQVPLDRADVVARWAAETARAEGAAVVRTTISMALRVALSAREAGLDLTGVTLTGAGEPVTPAKARGITDSGARLVANYAMTESGGVGKACVRPLDPTDVHLCEDMLALIQEPRRLEGSGVEVRPFCFTSLLPTAPKIMLNVESDDFGIVETRSCGCPLEEIGYRRHIRQIQSFGKLTGEGVTLIGTDMVHVLEDVLPARFGGSALDYQLQEREDERGFTRMVVLISPRVPNVDEQAVIEVVRGALRRGGPGADLAQAMWAQAGTFQVERGEPLWTERGKLIPFRRVVSA